MRVIAVLDVDEERLAKTGNDFNDRMGRLGLHKPLHDFIIVIYRNISQDAPQFFQLFVAEFLTEGVFLNDCRQTFLLRSVKLAFIQHILLVPASPHADIAPAGYEQLGAIRQHDLNPQSDFTYYVNCLDTHLHCDSSKKKVYEEMFEQEMQDLSAV